MTSFFFSIDLFLHLLLLMYSIFLYINLIVHCFYMCMPYFSRFSYISSLDSLRLSLHFVNFDGSIILGSLFGAFCWKLNLAHMFKFLLSPWSLPGFNCRTFCDNSIQPFHLINRRYHIGCHFFLLRGHQFALLFYSFVYIGKNICLIVRIFIWNCIEILF